MPTDLPPGAGSTCPDRSATDEGTRPAHAGTTAPDVSQCRPTRRALDAAEAKFQALVEDIPAVTYTASLDAASTTQYISPQIEQLIGFSPDEYRSDPDIWRKQLHPDDRQRVLSEVAQAHESGNPLACEYRMRTKSGDVVWFRDQARIIQDRCGRPVMLLGVMLDITQQKEMEAERELLRAQLGRQQKLEAIGLLAGGIAHEINNPINGIMNYAELIKDRLDGDDSASLFASEIVRETERVAGIVRNLLAFSRQTDAQEWMPVPVPQVVDATTSLIRALIRRDGIAFDVSVAPALPALVCQEQQIQQVIMNLLTNARDALNERYPQTHEDKRMRLDVCAVSTDGSDWLRLTVEDTGVGIPRDALDRIFDPFFTTKSLAVGRGLGLSTSHGIVNEHGGTLTVESRPGAYTRFRMDLPVRGPAGDQSSISRCPRGT